MPPFWRRSKFWQSLGQIGAVLLLLLVLGFLGFNLVTNLQRLNIQFGFNFLRSPAGFGIGEAVIPYQPTNSYWQALLVGLTNSLRVVLTGIVLATIVGFIAGVARLSDNWLLRQLAKVYVEFLRNTPLLLQLLFWYTAVFLSLPSADSPLALGFMQLSQAGVKLWGLNLSSEFGALLLGLTLYTGTFIAEIVRGGIQSVPQGQWEAARSLGLPTGLALRKIIIPQAMRTIIPSLGNQYLNLSKNSSLAIAIGYPDLYTTASTTFNQTGRAVEVMILISLTYLTVSLLISLLLNWYNRRIQFVAR
ncbi:ABC transporter permease subunit [filamentous cyanobacterium LEGE 11480]|uniref:ABC transporter permease subunit n=1 Tax=Romeriopsis navalis LEGE 11480 TaxID=2777977 RepID=A0A928VME7_9CYAN|nr:ABC transporter permease subunit [Romeriopsis navalis]MBE9029351.1 ABC transporter permease subunit [Romeriopsis navalis LEGE 11480]